MDEYYTEVFCWGANNYKQLGIGCNRPLRVPRFCSFDVRIKSVSCGKQHSALITYRGQLFTFGDNSDGRLGINDSFLKQCDIPCLVEKLKSKNTVKVSCGYEHTVAVLDNGEVYTWGSGKSGALGIGTLNSQWTPMKISFRSESTVTILNASAGKSHTALVDNKGRLFVTGNNEEGQLGIEDTKVIKEPTLVSWINEKVKEAVCGESNTLVLTIKGQVYDICKSNQLVFEDGIVSIAAGGYSAAITDKGKVYLWGTCTFGKLLKPTLIKELSNAKHISIGASFGLMLDREGQVFVWGESPMEDYKVPTKLDLLQGKVITQIACGGFSAIMLGQDISPTHSQSKLMKEQELLVEEYNIKTYKDELIMVEEQLNKEKAKRLSLCKEIEDERKRAYELEAVNAELETEMELLGTGINELEYETGNNLSELIRSCEEKVRKEKLERIRLEHKKNEEVFKLNIKLVEIDTLIKKAQEEKVELEYNKKIEEHSSVLKEYEIKYNQQESLQQKVVRLNSESEYEIEQVKKELKHLEEKKADLALQQEDNKNLINNIQVAIQQRQKELELAIDKYEDTKNALTFINNKISLANKAANKRQVKALQELEECKQSLQARTHQKANIKSQIAKCQHRITDLESEAEELRRDTKSLIERNSSLKNNVHDLKENNRKISDTIAMQERCSISESDRQKLKAIRGSLSPLHKVLSEVPKLNYKLDEGDKNLLDCEINIPNTNNPSVIVKSANILMNLLKPESNIKEDMRMKYEIAEREVKKTPNKVLYTNNLYRTQ